MKADNFNAEAIVNGWSDIKKLICERYGLSEIAYLTWIHNLSLDYIGSESVVIGIPSDNQYVKVYMENKYTEYFMDVLKELTGKLFKVEFALSR